MAEVPTLMALTFGLLPGYSYMYMLLLKCFIWLTNGFNSCFR